MAIRQLPRELVAKNATRLPLLCLLSLRGRGRLLFWPNLIDCRKFHRRIMSGKYRAAVGRPRELRRRRNSRGRCVVDILQFTTRYKLVILRCVLSTPSLLGAPFENDYRSEKSQWRNWSQCLCYRRCSHLCIQQSHRSASEDSSLELESLTKISNSGRSLR